jgi:uncharacterized protein
MNSKRKVLCLLSALLLLTYHSILAQPIMKSSSNQKTYAFRLKPHEDLKQGILSFAYAHKIKAGCIVTCVGSLEEYNLRFANQPAGTEQSGHFEIVSLVGTLSDTYAHLHLSLADGTGTTIGGHLLEGNKIYTTAEIVIMELTSIQFAREKDSTYGYDELVVKPKGN